MKYRKLLGIAGVVVMALLGAGNVLADDAPKTGGQRHTNIFDELGIDVPEGAAQCEKLYQTRQYKKAFPVCRKAAEQGVAMAQFSLGAMYHLGKGVKQDYAKAVNWYRKAAKQGHARAQSNLGLMYDKDLGVKRDHIKAAKWYRKAAEQGDAGAQLKLGAKYDIGFGVKQNYAEAANWYRKAAKQGVASAQYSIGVMYAYGQGVKQNYAEAVRWYRMAAEQGNANAQNNLGDIYAEGQGVKKDLVEAEKWYAKAAKQGDVSAEVSLADLYYAEKKFGRAINWYRKVASTTNPFEKVFHNSQNAQYNLGVMYANGQGVRKDAAEAEKWYRKAAEQGLAYAQFNLGLMYDNGQGVRKDAAEAEKWYRKAAEQGVAMAQSNLGLMYDNGQGVKKNYAEAAKWWRKAAEQGYAIAQYNLGVMYANGQGVMTSGAAAADWYYKAGLSFLKESKKEDALRSVERIKGLQTQLHLEVPNAFLADKLLARIYGENGTAQTSPKVKEKKAASVVSGTGWPVAGGYVVTNHHVVAGRKTIVLLRMDGTKIPASVAVDDATNDLALLKPDSSKLLPPALPLASRAARVGGHVFTVGYPHPGMMGKEPKLTDGIINARTGIKNDPRVYQISVPLQGGNSGGPLLNMRGEVVGITTSKMSAVKVFKWTGDLPQNVNYAVKVGYVRALLSSVDPVASVPVLPSKKDDLAGLAKRIEGSVLMVIAQ